MGCASSKRIEVHYKPAPASYASFDVNAIQEPWLVFDNRASEEQHSNDEKPAHVPAQILDKLNSLENETEGAPHTWDEVTKALGDLKPKPELRPKPDPSPMPSPAQNEPTRRKPRKSRSFHTLDELDNKPVVSKPAELKKSESMRSEWKRIAGSTQSESRVQSAATQSTASYIKPATTLTENIFIKMDRMEREKEGKMAAFDRMMRSKRDPLSDYPVKIPPRGAESVVVYTTSLRGVRRTYEDCCRVKGILEGHMVVYDERDVALHGEFLGELKELLGAESENAGVPRVFVKGRYLGGVDEVVELNESGVFGRMVKLARVERGVGWRACEGCGGARFVPCVECGGSCKVVVGDKRERCPRCNENGLVHCGACWAST